MLSILALVLAVEASSRRCSGNDCLIPVWQGPRGLQGATGAAGPAGVPIEDCLVINRTSETHNVTTMMNVTIVLEFDQPGNFTVPQGVSRLTVTAYDGGCGGGGGGQGIQQPPDPGFCCGAGGGGGAGGSVNVGVFSVSAGVVVQVVQVGAGGGGGFGGPDNVLANLATQGSPGNVTIVRVGTTLMSGLENPLCGGFPVTGNGHAQGGGGQMNFGGTISTPAGTGNVISFTATQSQVGQEGLSPGGCSGVPVCNGAAGGAGSNGAGTGGGTGGAGGIAGAGPNFPSDPGSPGGFPAGGGGGGGGSGSVATPADGGNGGRGANGTVFISYQILVANTTSVTTTNLTITNLCHIYGELYQNPSIGETLTLTTPAYSDYTGFTNVGLVSGTTVIDANQDIIIINTTAVYQVFFSISFSLDSTGTVEFAVAINHQPVTNVVAEASTTTSTDTVASGVGLLFLQKGDVVNVMFRVTAGSATQLFPFAGDFYIYV